MKFNFNSSIEILERTPAILETMLSNISEEWTKSNEGADTWSPYDIIGHFIHGEKTDWIQRMEIILSDGANKEFKPFDRFAQFNNRNGETIEQLLQEFKQIRQKNLAHFKSLNLKETDLQKNGIHPVFGEVTLSQLLSTWVVHDLNHLAQVSRVMAKQYKSEVGPWVEYLRILK
jgi:hypothetical protein